MWKTLLAWCLTATPLYLTCPYAHPRDDPVMAGDLLLPHNPLYSLPFSSGPVTTFRETYRKARWEL